MNPLVQLARMEATNKTLWEEVKAVRAENDRLRAELAEAHKYFHLAKAAIARVRELWLSHGLAVPPEIERALDGAE